MKPGLYINDDQELFLVESSDAMGHLTPDGVRARAVTYAVSPPLYPTEGKLYGKVLRPVVIAEEDPDVYQQAALSTVRPGVDVEMMCAVGLAGETGEVCEPIKKHRFHGKPLDKQHMKKEIGDVLWYATVLAWHYGFKLSEIMRENREKLAERYAALKAARAAEEEAARWVKERTVYYPPTPEMLKHAEKSLARAALEMEDKVFGTNGNSPETPDGAVAAPEDGSDRNAPVDHPPASAGPDGEASTPPVGRREAVGLTGSPAAGDDVVIDGQE